MEFPIRRAAKKLSFFFLILACSTRLAAGPGDVVITEIMYKPRIEQYRELLDFAKVPRWWEEGDDPGGEYVELYNTGPETVNLGGWSFVDGIQYDFPANTLLDAGDYLVVCASAATLRDHYGLSNKQAIGDFTGEISNAGERLTLVDDSTPRRIIDTFRFNDDPPWPLAPDQAGLSLELMDPNEDNSLAENWRAARITLQRENGVRSADPTEGQRRPLLGGTPAAMNTVHRTDGIPPFVDGFIHSPLRPTSLDDVTITATVTAQDAVTDVTLHYEFYREPYPYTGPVVSDSIAMAPGVESRTYIATVPAQVSQTLVRYRVEATDSSGRSATFPDDFELSPHRAYFHYDGEEETEIPTFFLIMSQSALDRLEAFNANVDNKDSVEATLVIDGIVYDHIRTRYRACRPCAKRSHKFKFNRHEYWNDMSRLDLDYDWPVLQKVASSLFWLAGHDNIAADLLRLNRNGDFFGVFLAQESPNGSWLERHGFDPDSEVFKAKEGGSPSDLPDIFRANLSYNPVPAGLYPKMYVKRGDSLGSFQSLIDLTRDMAEVPRSELTGWFNDNLMIDDWLYPWTIHMTQPHCDYAIKNYYVIKSPEPDGRWNIVYFDYDRFWGCLMFSTAPCHAITQFICGGTVVNEKMNTNRDIRSRTFLVLNDVTRTMLTSDAVNTLLDRYFSETSVDREEERLNVAGAQVAPDFSLPNIKEYYLDHSNFLLDTILKNLRLGEEDLGPQITLADPIAFEADDGFSVRIEWTHSEKNDNPAVVDLYWTDLGFSYLQPIATGIPAEQGSFGWEGGFSGFDNEIYIQARIRDGIDALDGRNTNLTSVALYDNIADQQFTPVIAPASGSFDTEQEITFTVEPDWQAYYTLDGSDPRVSHTRALYEGPFTVSSSVVVRAMAIDDSGEMISVLAESTYTTADPNYESLRITEIMYNPPGGQLFEFVEIENVGEESIDLFGVEFTNGITFKFRSNSSLEPGAYGLLVANPNAFEAAYPGVDFDGVFIGALANGGEKLTVRRPGVDAQTPGGVIASVDYDDNSFWPVSADGFGHSLVVSGLDGDSDEPESWRASASVGGSPGAPDPDPTHGGVVLHEVLTHGNSPLEDAIELFNTSTSAVDISGWYLSDNRDTADDLKAFRIPDGTVLEPREFVVFYENQFGMSPDTAGSFELNANGGSVFLSAATPTGDLTGYTTVQNFDAAAVDNTFGRYRTSTGLAFPRLADRSLGVDAPTSVEEFRGGTGSTNGAPFVGPVVINELHYHPADVPEGADEVVEFLELKNITGSPVPLHDASLGFGWIVDGITGIGGAGDFEFPEGAEIAANGFALVVPIDPLIFRSRTGLPERVPVYGPYGGALNNDGERVEIFRPTVTDGINVSYIQVDRLRFNDRAPWPVSPDGEGASLERQRATKYGDDVVNWAASLAVGGTPGVENSTALPDENLPPVARFSAADGGSVLTVLLDAQRSYDLDGTIVDYSWDFADEGGNDGSSVSGQLVSHRFPAAGVFQVTLTVTDSTGQTAQKTSGVEVIFTGVSFRRGDFDANGEADFSDALAGLTFLFLPSGIAPVCRDAADADNSGVVDFSDPLALLRNLFLGNTDIPPPGSFECGFDPLDAIPPDGEPGGVLGLGAQPADVDETGEPFGEGPLDCVEYPDLERFPDASCAGE